MEKRTAIVMFNLGGPDSLSAVQPFLYNLFSDPDIFKFPLGFLTQKIFAWMISRRRAPEASKGYAAIGGKSPLLENTQEQAIALQLALAAEGQFDVFVCMRYWHPRAAKVVAELKSKDYSRVVLLPLYPQFSATTTGSSYNDFMRACQQQAYRPEVVYITHWYDQPDYQQAIVNAIETAAHQFSDPDPTRIELLFSAHGLPKKIIAGGDPYEQHVRATYEQVCGRLGWPHTTLCYQSRVGPLEWLRPYTADVIQEKAAAGARQLLVYPIAFVSDHIETLYELGQEYAELAHRLGIAEYRVVPALNSDPQLIEALAQLVRQAIASHAGRDQATAMESAAARR